MTGRTSGGWGACEQGTCTGYFEPNKNHILIKHPSALIISVVLLSGFENFMFPPDWDLCMRTSIVHLVISYCRSSTRLLGGRRACVWAECDCSEAGRESKRGVRKCLRGVGATLAVSWADRCMWVTGSVSSTVCVYMRMEDDPPTLSHIGLGTLAVRGAHLLNWTHTLPQEEDKG